MAGGSRSRCQGLQRNTTGRCRRILRGSVQRRRRAARHVVSNGGGTMCSRSQIIPGKAVVPGHLHAVRELGLVPRARFFFAWEWLELHVFVAGIFGEAPQVCVIDGDCRVHASEWGRAGRSAEEGGGRNAIDETGRENVQRRMAAYHYQDKTKKT